MNHIAAPPHPASDAATHEPAADEHLSAALLESRQRWRDMALMAGDIVFETDANGRLVFLAPDPVIGWPVAALIGQAAEILLAGSEFSRNFNPFRPTAAVRRRRVWLKRPDGGSVPIAFASAPLLDGAGRTIGVRGIGQDVSAQDGYDAATATALRRGEVLDHILWRMRQEVLAPRMMNAALDSVVTAMGLEGIGVIDLMGDAGLPSVLHQAGSGLDAVMAQSLALLQDAQSEPLRGIADEGRELLVCPCQTRFGEQAGLLTWRKPGGRAFDGDDVTLISSSTGIIRVILEHESIQREMVHQARTDPLTSLLNRRAFFDDMTRRLDRLERDESPGTLMFIDLDNFKALNDCRGHDAGDEALCLTATLLRAAVRSHDLVARLGGDEFALWLDNTDEFAAAERAERLRIDAPRTLAHLTDDGTPALTMSIGIATRWPGRAEDVEQLTQRADRVMYEVKRSGRGHWRVSRAEEP